MEQRDELEVKLAWLEKHVLELDGVVRALADEVAALRTEAAELRAARARSEAEEEGATDLAYERPPHY